MGAGISSAAALNVEWTTTAITLALLITRLVLQRYQPSFLNLSSCLVLASIIIVGIRTGVTYYMLFYGTATDAILAHDTNYDPEYLEKIKIGSILALVARILITTFYWLQSIILLLLYTPLVSHLPEIKAIIRLCWFSIAASYVAVVLSTCLECRPFKLYWQVSPQPGHCDRAYVQITLQCVTNIIIDLELLAIASPILRVQIHDWRRQIKIGVLFAWILVSACVANLPTIYGSWKLRLRKRAASIRNTSQGTMAVDDEILMKGKSFSLFEGSSGVVELENVGLDKSTTQQHFETVVSEKTEAEKANTQDALRSHYV